MMPQMDGFAVCQAIRAMPTGRNMPILVAAGLDDVESIERAYRIAATDFIANPMSRPTEAGARSGKDVFLTDLGVAPA